MSLKRLLLVDFRNLQSAELRPAPKLNFLQGPNGSGKTSVLEGISTLALGRSFRTRKYRNIIKLDAACFSVFAELSQLDTSYRVGVARQRSGQSQFKINDRNVVSAAELAHILPYQVINSQSFMLLEGGPTERRRFLDWMVFHVKHSYRELWADYARCLKQRNTLLRSGKIAGFEFQIWDTTLSALAEQIDQLRLEVLEGYLPELADYLQQFAFIGQGELSVDYQKGWAKASSLQQQLDEARDRDVRAGFTTIGPHKADIKIKLNKKDAAEIFSRGQQKALVAAMYMAQMNVFQKSNGKDCVLLIDDLPAELDQENQQMLCGWVARLQRVQTFITGIDLRPTIESWPEALAKEDCKMFHVKHGQVTEYWSDP